MRLTTTLATLLFLLLPTVSFGARRTFRFAMAVVGETWDFGFVFHQNLARIDLQKYLTQKYPDMVTSHAFAQVPSSFNANCDPQFEAWVKEGYDLIFGVTGHTWCFARLAGLYPNVVFVSIAGSASGPSNFANLWLRLYQDAYLAGYTAGLMTTTKKVCVSAGLRIPAPVMDVSGFCRGVHNADPTVEIHLMETGMVTYALMENWNVNQSHALGCDVVFVDSVEVNGCIQADKLGVMSIGSFTDARVTVGETVITSLVVNFTPMLIRAAEAILNGTFANETKRADWWMGWEWGAMGLSDPSFLVPANVSARVQAQVVNISRVFCGRVCTKGGCLCNNASCCLTDADLGKLVLYPDFVIEHGVMQVPGKACKAGQLGTWHIENFTMVCSDCPPGTYAYNADQISECRPCSAGMYSSAGSTNCTICPAGTYSDQPGRGQCILCPSGSVASNAGATRCTYCPSEITNDERTECGSPSLVWLAGVGCGVGVLLMVVAVWMWWASRKMRRLRKQFSNDNVAVECAAAIARLDLGAVAWLSTIPDPNCIQLSFIRIVKILDQVRKYVPDQLLQTLAAGDDQQQEEETDLQSDARAASQCPIVSPRSGQESNNSASRIMKPTHNVPHHRSISSSLDGQRLFFVRKVTYMLIRYDFCQHEAIASQAEQNLSTFLSHLIDVVRAHGGTVGIVMYDHAVIHWGTSRSIAEAPMRAVETAMAVSAFSGKLKDGLELKLNIAIGCGNANTGVIETATNHFFVVGGGEVPLVQRMAGKNWRVALGVQILITEAVRTLVQYSYFCHPRLVDGENILWEPVAYKKEKGANEWMYQLEESEVEATASPEVLLAPFMALRKGDFALTKTLTQDLLQQGNELSPVDLAALRLLASNAAACTRHSL